MNLINIKDANGNPTNNYKFRLKFYRDVTGINIPSAFNFTIKTNGSNTQVGTFIVNKINPQTIVSVSSDGCPPIINNNTNPIELGIYESNPINMSTYNNISGYYVYTELFARHPGIKNVQGSSDQYALLMTMEFPAMNSSATTKYNSSPAIDKLPATYFCLQKPANFSVNAYDPDGDSLVFSLTQPLDYGTTKPFYAIPYDTSYGLNTNILDGNPDITINRFNGNISFTPTKLGRYLIAYKIDEYRNSIKIGEIRRELQIEIVLCQEAAPILKDVVNNTTNLTKDTIAFTKDTTFKSTFRVSDIYGDSLFLRVLPDTGLSNIFDTSQFKTNWHFNDTLALPYNINGLNTKGKGVYNLNLKWNIDSTDIKKTPYHFRLIALDKTCPKPLSDTLDVELLITGQCFQNVNRNLIACDSLVDFKGRVFYNDTTTTDTILSYIGCDKILIQNIKIKKSSAITYITNSGCDSILAIDGNVYYSDTTVQKVYQSSNRCDSLVSQKLTIIKSINLPIRGFNQITDLNVNYYYAVDSIANVTYSWEVNNGQIISGNNSNLVEVKWNGSGSLKCYTYFDSTCLSYSSFDVNMFVGIDDEINSEIKIYPNPTSDILTLELTNTNEAQKISLYNVHGRLILEKYINDTTELDVSDLESGVYMLRINDHTYKLLKL